MNKHKGIINILKRDVSGSKSTAGTGFFFDERKIYFNLLACTSYCWLQ